MAEQITIANVPNPTLGKLFKERMKLRSANFWKSPFLMVRREISIATGWKYSAPAVEKRIDYLKSLRENYDATSKLCKKTGHRTLNDLLYLEKAKHLKAKISRLYAELAMQDIKKGDFEKAADYFSHAAKYDKTEKKRLELRSAVCHLVLAICLEQEHAQVGVIEQLTLARDKSNSLSDTIIDIFDKEVGQKPPLKELSRQKELHKKIEHELLKKYNAVHARHVC